MGVEASISGHHLWHAPEFALLCFHGGSQQMPVTRPFHEYLVMRDDLVLRFLDLHQLSELIRLTRLSLADQLGMRFKDTQHFVGELRHSLEHPCFGLPYHATHLLGYGLQLFTQPAHTIPAPPRPFLHFSQYPLAVIENLPS